jgi:hypothetical protein
LLLAVAVAALAARLAGVAVPVVFFLGPQLLTRGLLLLLSVPVAAVEITLIPLLLSVVMEITHLSTELEPLSVEAAAAGREEILTMTVDQVALEAEALASMLARLQPQVGPVPQVKETLEAGHPKAPVTWLPEGADTVQWGPAQQ